MSRFEFWLFKKLLIKFCKQLDQWELWKVNTRYGKVYIEISRAPHPGSEGAYHEIK